MVPMVGSPCTVLRIVRVTDFSMHRDKEKMKSIDIVHYIYELESEIRQYKISK